MSNEQLLLKVVEKILNCLSEISLIDNRNEFIEGEESAYFECIEIIQEVFKSKTELLNFDVEQIFNYSQYDSDE